jgi:membrane protein implicated in regulation of membrane protease activity
VIGVAVGHGRIVREDQIWRANDPRRLKAVRVLAVSGPGGWALVVNLVTGVISAIALKAFTIGSRGWSLERHA